MPFSRQGYLWSRVTFSLSVLSLSIASLTDRAIARPAPVFVPYLSQIQRAIPPNAEMRLPAQILLGGPGGLNPDLLLVKVLPTTAPPRLTVSLFTCGERTTSCLIGSFAAQPIASSTAQRELRRHQATATSITLTDQVRGYLIDGLRQNPTSDISSLMWQQDDIVYTISFPASERQNILYMARQMAVASPLKPLQTP
ncbi:hypothetical protein [Leptolyngbya ohadii]|uniref:hypothetical protein n=1 Tax=Leptolyngbya ohadii TaxID=1962290 RepID=UPI00117BAD7A|nr:hypothetical protein [Leptolyngbya ohadii]